MALQKVKGNLDRIFLKNMTDLVRGIRNSKDQEAKYIANCMEEIKMELRQDNIAVKANAITKLAYLQMLGYDISWAGFNIIEVMSSSKFTHKRIGYLSASQCFHADQELLMLTTNMIRKDLNSQNQYEAGNALSALACFVSSDLARDLSNDILTLLTSTKPYLRKKGVLMLYKIFLKYPDALRPAFPRLKEKLEDPDPGVQSAAVNVICELARKNPKNYLSLAPIFFRLMTTSTNNWMLIKIIKLFGALTPLEPRLGKKLIEPLTNLIHSTSAMSLLYECINTTIAVLISISTGMPNHSSSIHLCVQKLRILIEDSDQNLKYLGLLAMSKILPTHPKSVQTHKDLIMRCLDDKDESIRLRALDLLYGMVNKKNLMEIVKKLLVHMEKAEGTTYRDELLSKIIQICSQNSYQHITNFEWYVSVLVELTRVEGLSYGELVASQLLDVAIRVQAIRPFAVQQMSLLLENPFAIFGLSGGLGTSRTPSMHQVLYAAAWICGEYTNFLPTPKSTLLAMLESRVTQLPHNIQSVYLQNCLKILAHILTTPNPTTTEEEKPQENGGGDAMTADLMNNENSDYGIVEKTDEVKVDENQTAENKTNGDDDNHRDEYQTIEEAAEVCPPSDPIVPATTPAAVSAASTNCPLNLQEVQDKLRPFVSSDELEVQERASTMFNIIKCYLKVEAKGEWDTESFGAELAHHFTGELNPVAPKAQKKVPVPEGLDLDAWINDPPSDSEEEEEFDTADVFSSAYANQSAENFYGKDTSSSKKAYQPTPEELTKQRETRLMENELNPHYLKGSTKTSPTKRGVDNDIPPIEKLNLNIGLQIPGLASSDKYLEALKREKSKSKKVKHSKKKRRSRKGGEDNGEEGEHDEVNEVDPTLAPSIPHVVNSVVEMPEGATLSDNEESNLREDDPHRALNIDLDVPLEPNEVIPIPSHRKTKKTFDPHYLNDGERNNHVVNKNNNNNNNNNNVGGGEEVIKSKSSRKGKTKSKSKDHAAPVENAEHETNGTKKSKDKHKSKSSSKKSESSSSRSSKSKSRDQVQDQEIDNNDFEVTSSSPPPTTTATTDTTTKQSESLPSVKKHKSSKHKSHKSSSSEKKKSSSSKKVKQENNEVNLLLDLDEPKNIEATSSS